MSPRTLCLALPLVLAACGTPSSPTDAAATQDSALTDAVTQPDASPAADAAYVAPDALSTFRDSYPLAARFPEGGTYDPTSNAFYVGSLADGSVHRIDAATGADTVVFTETATGRWWTLGMDVDVARRRLWVCAMDDSQTPRAGSVWVFDMTTGMRIANHPLASAAMNASCTDVALTPDGRGYVPDREQGNMYRVDLTAGPTLFAQSDELSAALVGQNATVALPDQSALLTILYSPPGLVRVDLADASVRRVAITGGFTDTTALAGADGLTLYNGSAYVMFTSKLVRVTPTSADWSHASAVGMSVPDGMTDVVSTPNGLYLLNGQSVRFALSTPTDPFALVRFAGPL